MANIICKLCSKTFKSESGHGWHVDHQHQLMPRQNHAEIDTYEQRDDAADEVQSPSPDILEQPVETASYGMTETGTTPRSETTLADAVAAKDLSEEIARLAHRLEELQVEVGTDKQTRDWITESETKMSSLESRLGGFDDLIDVRRQNKWDKRGAFKACNLDANRLRQFSDLPTSVRLDSFASPPVSSPVWRLAVRGTYPPA